jgi:predicted ATP-dependent serine protease
MLSIVVIAGLISSRLEKIQMSKEPDSTFSEQGEKQDLETAETNTQVQSDKSFHEKVDEFQNGEREKNPWNEIPKWKLFGGIGGGVLAIILSILFSLSGNPGWGLIFLSLPIVAPLVLTEGGREFLKTVQEEIQDGNQVQQNSTQSKPKRICSDCGWQNPQENSYCHDCGSELGNSG